MTIALVIGWKFPDQEGMSTEDGVITAFPGGIPSQEDQDTWTAEYDLFTAKNTVEEQIKSLRDEKMNEGALISPVNETFRTTNLDSGYAQSTRFNKDRSSESQSRNISSITLGSTTVVTMVGHQFSVGNDCYFTGIVGTTELNATAHQIIDISGNDVTFSVDSTAYTPYVSGGQGQLGGSMFDIDGVSFGMGTSDFNAVTDGVTNIANLQMRNARRLINEMRALTTAAAVYAFNIDQGWP